MVEMRFRLAGRQPVPVAEGEAIEGAETFTVDAMAKRVKWPKQALAALWEAFFPPAEDDADDQQQQPTPGGLPKGNATVAAAVERAVTTWQLDPHKVLIRASDFAAIGDADLALFLARAAQRGLNPWRREVFARFEQDDRRQSYRLMLIVSIEKKREIAHATGQYAGLSAVEYEYDGDGCPTVARVKVKRVVDGRTRTFVGEAYFEEFYPGETAGDSLWDTKPRVCLATCAESAGLNRAFPQLGGLYTAAELARSRGYGGARRGSASGLRSPGRDDEDVEQPFPDDTYAQV